MNPIYRHKLTIGTQQYTVHPVYKDDMAVDYQHESQQMFFRASLSGKMDFIGEDASRIIGAPFTTEYVLTIEESWDMGLTWSVFHTAKFYQTDCTINIDDLKVTVKPDVKDQYQKVLDGLDKEFNLIELAPVIESIKLAKRGIIQIYGSGDDTITNIQGGLSWEEDFDLSGKDPLEYHFTRSFNRLEMVFENPIEGLGGIFKGVRDNEGNFRLDNDEGIYYIYHERRGWYGNWITEIRRISDDGVSYEAWGEDVSEITFIDPWAHQLKATTTETNIYSRWLCDVSEAVINGETKYPQPLSADDPSYGGNLHYAIGYIVYTMVQSERTSTEPTQWGRKNQQEYFNTPSDDNYYIPVFRSSWEQYSFWYYNTSEDYYIESRLRKYYYLKDAFPLWSVIQVLLDKLETGVTFQPTAAYSEFFYSSANPIDTRMKAKPYITPKSNITAGEYSQPAMKAPVTLGTILEMLKKAFGCYWYIDDDMNMHIEHISWFKNGGSYNQTHEIGIDVTKIEQATNLKRWSFGKNNYSFDKEEMPARYQYKWMDDGTDYFDGQAIEIVSPFVQTDKVEEINVSNFTSDVDYMLVAPENVSKDGFALLMAESNAEGNYLPIESRGTAYHILQIQNIYASMTYLEPAFLISNLPAWRYNLGDLANQSAKGIIRGKKQKIQIPLGSTVPDMMKLIRTGLGDGQVERMSINLSSRMADTTLKFDTYDL